MSFTTDGKFEEMVEKILAHRNVNVNCQPAGRWPPLHQAAYVGDGWAVTMLLDLGADPESAHNGTKALDVAKNHGHLACARLLLCATVLLFPQ